jgi:hypothetical protein
VRYSVTLIALVVFLVLVSGVTGVYALRQESVFFTAICIVTAASAIGLALLRPIAKYLFFASAALIVYWWVRTIIAIVEEGWPHMDAISSAISLIPGALLISICVFGSVYVHRITRRSAA